MTKSYERGDKTEDHSFRKSKLGEIIGQNKFFFCASHWQPRPGTLGGLGLGRPVLRLKYVEQAIV